MALNIDRSLRLSPSQYIGTAETKSGIAIHHTVGASARSSFNHWNTNPEQVGTAYIIDRDGTIYEVFPPESWAWQFGLPWSSERRIPFEKRFIGIEIASEGGLIEHGGELYCFDKVSERTKKRRDEAFDYGDRYRQYRFFDRYEAVQVSALVELMNDLCDRFQIPRQVPEKVLAYYGDLLENFLGIIGHAMVRKDKTDPLPDVSFWNRVIADCNLTRTTPMTLPPGPGAPLTTADIDRLFDSNVQQINVMNVAAGSLVKGLIMELERNGRNTYIRLHDATNGGHNVSYDLVQGDVDLVLRLARSLGFEEVTPTSLKVPHG